jgi:hypothetical protein
MNPVVFYLIQSGLGIGLLYLFYLLILRRLSFFHSIRWYFLVGICLVYTLPFIQVELPSEPEGLPLLSAVPSIQSFQRSPGPTTTDGPDNLSKWIWLAGLAFFSLRMFTRLASLYYLHRKSKKLNHPVLSIFQSEDAIAPFSFGGSIYVNSKIPVSEEYEKIIAHEWIHIRGRHSVDLLIAELICIIHWFIPFSWWLKTSIRKNLEYLTDDEMIRQYGDAKGYQYLLLESLGRQTYSFTSTFNIHSLKSRICMINRPKSSAYQKSLFLFSLPLVLFLLYSFRKLPSENFNEYIAPILIEAPVESESTVYDTVPPKKKINRTHGSHEVYNWTFSTDDDPLIKRISIQSQKDRGEIATIEKKDGSKETYDLTNDKDSDVFFEKYGHIGPIAAGIPVMPPVPPAPVMPGRPYPVLAPPPAPAPPNYYFSGEPGHPAPPAPPHFVVVEPAPPAPPAPPHIEMAVPAPPAPMLAPLAPIPPIPPVAPFADYNFPDDIENISISDEKVRLEYKNGEVELYDLDDPAQKKKFKEKYKNKTKEKAKD